VSSTAAASPETEIAPQARELVRGLSLRDAIALVLTVIGTGVFLKTATMAQLVGSPSRVLLAWVAAGLLSLAGALTYAELGAMMPEAGGEYVFLREAKLGGIAIIVFGAFLLSRTGSWAHLKTSEVARIAPAGVGAFGAAMIAALWAYQGWANVPMVAGEIEKPERNIPRALIYGMLIVILVYLITNLAYFYALPFSEILTTNSTAYRDALPVAAAAAQTFSSYGAQIVSIAFAIAAIGALNAITMMNARVPFAMARDGLFFRQLGNLSPTSLVPVNAIWFLGIWASVLALAGTFDQITTAAIFGVWLFTALVGSSLFILRNKLPAAPRRYRTPGYPVVPALFVLVALWLVVNTVTAYPVESIAGLVLMALGLPFYFLFRASGWLARARMKDRPH